MTNTGLILRILPKTLYDFTNIANGSAITIPLASKVDVSVFTEAVWIIRGHSATITGSIAFTSLLDGYDFGDPATSFSANGGTSTFTGGTPIPAYTTLSAGSNFGRLIGLKMVATQSAGGGTMNIQLSVDLALKGGDPRELTAIANFYRGYRVQ